MTAHQSLIPALPTVTPDKHTPTTCFVCSRSAAGIGFGTFKRGADPMFVCLQCLPLIENLRAIMDFNPHELKAVEGAVEVVGEYLERIGKTDLAEFEAEEAEGLVREAILGFGASLRREIATGVPF